MANARPRKNETVEAQKAVARLGAEVRRRRKHQGLTQGTLGRLSGTGINFVGQIEMGKPTAQIGKVLQVLKVLGVELRLGYGAGILRVENEENESQGR